jgi:hypothetical protein
MRHSTGMMCWAYGDWDVGKGGLNGSDDEEEKVRHPQPSSLETCVSERDTHFSM